MAGSDAIDLGAAMIAEARRRARPNNQLVVLLSFVEGDAIEPRF